jgi:Putative zinc-finger
MNCKQFNDQLPDYLDKTLPAAVLATARDHVHKCDACQRTLARQEALAKSIRRSLHHETERLSLRPETRRNILNALKQPELSPPFREGIQTFFISLWRQPAWAGAILLCLLLLVFGGHFILRPATRFAPPMTAKNERITYVFDVPIQTETHVYRRQNNMVVDAVVTGAGVIDASFSENMSQLLRYHNH